MALASVSVKSPWSFTRSSRPSVEPPTTSRSASTLSPASASAPMSIAPICASKPDGSAARSLRVPFT